MGSIYSIVYHPIDGDYASRSPNFIRVPVEQATLVAGHGIEGDQKAGHQPGRQINLLSREWLLGLEDLGYRIEPGQFGEQIALLGINFNELKCGDILQLGATACIETGQPRNPCRRLRTAQGSALEPLKAIGVMGAVVVGGTIRVGDPVTRLETRECAFGTPAGFPSTLL